MNILSIIKETTSDGPGLRCSIYTAGCNWKCKGCHNAHTWNSDQGTPYYEQLPEIINYLYYNLDMLDGITISGGDPFYDPIGLYQFLKAIRSYFPNINIWCYTGYRIEDILSNNILTSCLEFIDTLVDGPFVLELKQFLNYRGSSNQRIINIKKTLEQQHVVLELFDIER